MKRRQIRIKTKFKMLRKIRSLQLKMKHPRRKILMRKSKTKLQKMRLNKKSMLSKRL